MLGTVQSDASSGSFTDDEMRAASDYPGMEEYEDGGSSFRAKGAVYTAITVNWRAEGGESMAHDNRDAPSGGATADGTREVDGYSSMGEYGDGGTSRHASGAVLTKLFRAQ